MDTETSKKVHKRLRIIEGQIRGLQRLLDEDAYCVDFLTQISAVHNALRGVSKTVVRQHLSCCIADAVKRDDGEAYFDELIDIMYKLNK